MKSNGADHVKWYSKSDCSESAPPSQKFVCIHRPLYLSHVSKYLNLKYNTEVKEIVELYLSSPSVPSWPVLE
jgi:hypothetical protein